MTVLLTGATGQVGSQLAALYADELLVATDRSSLDLTCLDAIRSTVRSVKPRLILNAAAYTAVDRAESEPEKAMQTNAFAPGVLAEEARRLGALLVHFSTDYVFDGKKVGGYREDDATAPLNVYGRSKLAGEQAISASGCRHLIIRTSWVYGPHGRNFLLAILSAVRRGQPLRVVNDQHGAPTSSREIAAATRRIEQIGAEGTFHVSSGGVTTWHGFATEIVSRAKLDVEVVPISTAEYPTLARRPRNSVLDNGKVRKLGIALPDWRAQLQDVIARLLR